MGGPLGGVILGRRGPYGGRGPGPGPGSGGTRGPRTQSAGTAEIARDSGGDSMPVQQASAFETTLARIRQRYALHFHQPEGAKPGEERSIQVELADSARRRYPEAEVRYRRVYLAAGAPAVAAQAGAEPTVITRAPVNGADPAAPTLKRRQGVDQPSGPHEGPLDRTADQSAATPQPSPAPQPDATPAPQGGWRKLKPGEQP